MNGSVVVVLIILKFPKKMGVALFGVAKRGEKTAAWIDDELRCTQTSIDISIIKKTVHNAWACSNCMRLLTGGEIKEERIRRRSEVVVVM